MLKKIVIFVFAVCSLSSCVTYVKNASEKQELTVSDKYHDDILTVYFAHSDDADLQNVELFRELILEKKMFKEVLLIQSQKIETCKGHCVLFENKKSGLTVAEKLNMGITYLSLGIIPARFTNIYSLKNKRGQVEEIEIVNWVSLFLVAYVNNKTTQRAEEVQLTKLQNLLDQAM